MEVNDIHRSRKQEIHPPLRSPDRDKSFLPKDSHPANSDSGCVLLIGPANGGKTQTIRSLFRNRVSPQTTGPRTAEVVEFGVNNLRIVDTPGLAAQPYSTERDARIIATLKKYLDQHPVLRSSIPNAVVLVTKFNDPGIQSPSSPFVQSLRAICLLKRRLLSEEYCNLIVLLTHFMNMRRWVRENPNPQIQVVRNLVRQYLKTSCHVVCGENEGDGWGLPRLVSGHRLPTGDIYPGNLIDIILEVMRRSGYATSAFEERGQILNLLNTIPMVSDKSSRYKKALEALNWAKGVIILTI